MKKILLSALAVVMSAAMWADVPTEYTLSFSATDGGTVSVTGGATGTVVCTKAIKNSGWAGRTACIVQDQNGNAGANYTFTITLSGLDAGFSFDAIDADLYAFNGGGGSQNISTTDPGYARCWNMIYKVGGNLFANNSNVDICMNAEQSTMTNAIIHAHKYAYTTYPATFSPDAEGNMTITLQCTAGSPNAGSFLGLGDVRLYTYDKRPIAINTFSTALTDAKANLETARTTYAGKVSTKLGDYTASGDTISLKSAIATAEGFIADTTAATTAQNFFDAAEPLKAAIVTYSLNVPQEGDVFYLKSAVNNKYVAFNTAGEAVALVDTPEANCILAFLGGSIVSYGTGLSHNNVNKVAATDATAETVKFFETIVTGNTGLGRTIVETSNTGNRFWQVTSAEATSVQPRDFSNYPQCEFVFEEVATIPVSFANQYSTFICPAAVNMGSNVEAYVASNIQSTYIGFTKLLGTAIPANTPVLLKNLSAEESDFDLEVTTGVGAYEGINLLRGGVKRQAVTSGYILYKDQFMPLTAGYLAAHKAYVYVDAPEVNGLSISFDGETGINNVNATSTSSATDAIYNLAGQRINKMQKGINIVNGKKVMF